MPGRLPGALPAEVAGLHADSWTAPFWDAAREERLVVATCQECGRVRMPPGPFCPACSSQSLVWTELPGGGEVFAFTTVRHAMMPVYVGHVPYVVALVELDGAAGTRIVGNVVTDDVDSVHTGMRVQAAWDHVSEEITILRFVSAHD